MKHNWEYKRLGEVCFSKSEIKRASKLFSEDDQISYIDISSIDNKANQISSFDNIVFKDAPSRAQQVLRKGDILYSIVRPNLKNIALLNFDAHNIVGSTGFCVLRGKTALPKYILYYVLSSKFTNYILKHTYGAAYPAVTEDKVKNAIMPIPPYGIQGRIVAELDELNKVIELKREQLKQFDLLAQSIFYDMFGDPAINPNNYPIVRLEDICQAISTGITYKPDMVAEEGTIVLRSSNIQNYEFVLDDIVRVQMQLKPTQYVKKNDILMCSRNGSARLVGKVALIPDILEPMSWGAFMTIVRSEYYQFLFHYFQLPCFRTQLTKTKTTTVNQITIGMLKSIQLPVPSIELQNQFAAKIEAIEKQKDEIEKSLKELQMLLDSRMDYWFN